MYIRKYAPFPCVLRANSSVSSDTCRGLYNSTSGQFRMAQVFLRMHCRALYCSCVTVLVVTNVTIVNNYIGSINHKYHVTMAMAPPTINMVDTWDGFHEMQQVKTLSTSFIVPSGYLFKAYSERMHILLTTMRQWQPGIGSHGIPFWINSEVADRHTDEDSRLAKAVLLSTNGCKLHAYRLFPAFQAVESQLNLH